ncbi:MAG: NUDIX domain-containing protein [Sandaracinaceae bacterium]
MRSTMDAPVIEAAVALVVFDGRALVLRRPPRDRRFPNQWCLPGGQLEPGESPEDGVRRECLEETRLVIELTGVAASQVVEVHQHPIRIHPFWARCDTASVVLSHEHTDHRWLTPEDAARPGTLPSGLAGEVTRGMLDRFAEGGAPA